MHWVLMEILAEVHIKVNLHIHSLCVIVLFTIDIDECETAEGDVCEQLCINKDGSFACDCRPQYVLTTDQFTCLGNIMCAYKTM